MSRKKSARSVGCFPSDRPSFDQTLLSRVAGSDLGFASAVLIEKVSHRGIEGGGDPSEPVEGNPAASFLEVREGPR